jgi:aminoglycoside 6'-N-acetyltransferase I
MRIVDLTRDRVDDTAALLQSAFRGRSDEWLDAAAARRTVDASLDAGNISRVALDDADDVIGWIGAMPSYRGNVWEIHPIVVAQERRRTGVGRALIGDVERLVGERGGLTLWAGSDDENGETSLGGADLYDDIAGAIQNIRNLRGHPYEFFLNVGFRIAGVLPDANGPGKPDIFLAKPVVR